MKATDPYEFPFPECDPPLTKDSSDIAQIRDLAQAVDSEVTRLEDFAESEFIRPVACKLSRGALANVNTGQAVQWGFIDFDNSPLGNMGETGGIRVPVSGLWFISGYISTTQLFDRTRVQLSIQGVGTILDEGVGYGTPGNQMTGSITMPVYAGQLIQLVMAVAGSGSSINAAQLAVSRITGL